ncbi:MAG TPA: hypothetical protein VKP08_12455, partial [Anaerolineales bacterium]|nr:hypothetical protein [Anaerolineales bacterium]
MERIIHDFLCLQHRVLFAVYNTSVEQNYSELLEKTLSTEQLRLLQLVREQATQAGLPLYIVGGAVRDLVLGRRLNDLDLIVEGDATRLAHSLVSRHGGKATIHSKFGTAKWFLPHSLTPASLTPNPSTPATLDLISARSEIYKHPAALPTVSPGSLADDLRRRDFTINALALRLDGPHFGELRDDFRGMEDLREGIIRVLHPGSFIDDPTRMYRAVRYAGRYEFRIAEDTLALIPAARSLVEKLSAQRIRHELDLILDESDAVSMLSQLDELGLLTVIHPALRDFGHSNLATPKLDDASLQKRTARWALWLMHLTTREIEALHERLHFTAELLKILLSASKLNANLSVFAGLKPSQVVELLDEYSIKAIEVVSCAVQSQEIKDVLTKYLSEWRHVQPKTTG